MPCLLRKSSPTFLFSPLSLSLSLPLSLWKSTKNCPFSFYSGIHQKMKMRNKGKVYPSPSSSSSSSSSCTANRDALSVLKLLPAAILALVSVLSLEDREVLAYMITRSMKSPFVEDKKKSNKKSNIHKPPLFDCDCFDCYTSYWFRWDSSPNRELIHQAIEAFEEHLATGEQSKKTGRGKKREKLGRRGAEKPADLPVNPSPEIEPGSPEVEDSFAVVPCEKIEASPLLVLPENAEGTVGDGGEEAKEKEARNESLAEEVVPPEAVVAMPSPAANNHKGLARKVLPDVVGLLNSRLWSLWSPNV